MSRAVVLLVALTAIAGTPLTRADEKKDDKKDELQLTAEERAVFDRTNDARLAFALKPLKVNPRLMEAARKHAENMAKQDKLEHVLDDKAPADRTKAAGYKSRFVGENIAWNQPDAKAVLAGWMDSEGHRDNILNKAYTEIGVAVAKNAKGEPYWVQVFGKP